MKTKQLATNAMLAAMCAILGYISITVGGIRVSFEGLPVLIAALLFGPVDAMLVGGIGTFIFQLVRWGIEFSTPLWMLPFMMTGLIIGYIAKKGDFQLSERKMRPLIILSELILFLFNTLSLYIYAIYVIGSEAYVITALPFRILILGIKSVGYVYLVPVLIKSLRLSLKD